MGKSRRMSFMSTLPLRMKEIKLVQAPMTAAALFVPSTWRSGSPVIINAGIEISPPPPTTASMNAEKKPMMQMKSSISKPIIHAS